jgi:hypothetical protein
MDNTVTMCANVPILHMVTMVTLANTVTFVTNAVSDPSLLWLGKPATSVSFCGKFCLIISFMKFQTARICCFKAHNYFGNTVCIFNKGI